MQEKFQSVAMMALRTWLTHQGIVARDFAEMIGVSENMVLRYRAGRYRPRDEVRLVIERVTNGAVRPGDWSVRYEG